MHALDVALVAMVSTWTLVSVVLGVMVILALRKVHGALDRIQDVLATAQQVASDVRAPVRAVSDSVREVFAPRVPLTPPDGLAQP